MPHAQWRLVRVGAAVVAAGAAVLGAGWLGLLALVGVEVVHAARGGVQRSTLARGFRPAVPMLLMAASCGLLVAATPHIAGQVVYTAVYGAAAVWWAGAESDAKAWGLAAANQFLALSAIFVGLSVLHIPLIVVLVLAWGSAYAIADYVLARQHDAARNLLAVAWALVVAELTWVLSVWLIHYVLAGGALIIPLPAVVITGFGYSFAGIYFSHLRGRLNRARLLEYLLIGGVFLVLVILGTKWSGG